MTAQKDKAPIKIAVVDDEVSIRELVSNHINTLDNCKVMIQAADGQEFLDKLQMNPGIDLVILDIIMDGIGGYQAAEITKSAYPDIRILFYSICKTELALARMAASGGHGLIRKGESSSSIATAIKTVMGGHYFFPGLEEKIAITQTDFVADKKRRAGLSAAEIGFLQLAGTEKTYKEIAAYLKISARQLDYIREGLFKRYNVINRVGLAILAYRSGISTGCTA